MKLGPGNNNSRSSRSSSPSSSSSAPSSLPFLPRLPPPALQWSAAASTAAAVSYADRGASAIAASSLLDELHWSESQLGEVQGAFFLGYALTQVLGGMLGGAASAPRQRMRRRRMRSRSGGDDDDDADGISSASSDGEKTGGYRTVLPLSLFFTGAITLLFPLAATSGGHAWACADRFCLGLLEGLLLPAAMAGVSDTTAAAPDCAKGDGEGEDGGDNNKATASAIVIAGCYLGSAWAYLSAYFLFGEDFQIRMAGWGYGGSIWPLVFYVNGVLSMACLLFFREEFNFIGSFVKSKEGQPTAPSENKSRFALTKTGTAGQRQETLSAQNNIWKDTISIANATLASKSGRAIIAAQIGQGALLYTIASWGPLYLERVAGVVPPDAQLEAHGATTLTSSPSVSAVAVTASVAASSLILPQLTQASVGVSVGAAADRLSSKIGTRATRRALQLISGVGPAAVLWYLSRETGNGESVVGGDSLSSPAFLFGAAQAVSALSLGAVSVSHLDVATPSSAGAVYALGNLAAAASGSCAVNLFGRLLEDGATSGVGSGGGGAEFAVPFRVVAILSAVGSLIYGLTVESELEIGVNGTAIM